MGKIIRTKDYGIFKKNVSNRDLDIRNVDKIKHSIMSQNLLEFRPIIVDIDMSIIDGQHRLQAAKELGVDVWYLIDEKSTHENILLLNKNQKVWDLDDYLNYFLSLGRVEYIKFNEFKKQESLNCMSALRILNSSGGRVTTRFKSGGFKFPDIIQIEDIKDILKYYRIAKEIIEYTKIDGAKLCRIKVFTSAMLEFLKNGEVNRDLFISKLKLNISNVHKCYSLMDYVVMFKEVYNWKNQNKIG